MKIHLKNYILYRIVQLASFSLRTAHWLKTVWFISRNFCLFFLSVQETNSTTNPPIRKKGNSFSISLLSRCFVPYVACCCCGLDTKRKEIFLPVFLLLLFSHFFFGLPCFKKPNNKARIFHDFWFFNILSNNLLVKVNVGINANGSCKLMAAFKWSFKPVNCYWISAKIAKKRVGAMAIVRVRSTLFQRAQCKFKKPLTYVKTNTSQVNQVNQWKTESL